MSFPTHDVVQGQMMFYRLWGIADDVNKVLAGTDLKAEVGHTPNLLQYVKVPLPDGGAVTLAADARYPGAWLVTWPKASTGDVTEAAWPLETDHDVLVKIFSAAVQAAGQGHPLPSPFCWGRVNNSPLVQLADRLVASGVDRGAVSLGPLRTLDDDGRPRAGHGNLNELRLTDKSDPERTLVIRVDTEHGWSVDQLMPQVGGSGRLDLPSALGLRPATPRVEVEHVELDVVAQLLLEDTFWVDVLDDDQRHLTRYAETPEEVRVYSRDSAERAATAWLRWAGFIDPAADRTPATITPAVEVHIDYTEKQVGIGGVQRYKGMAAVSGRIPVVVARSGFSKNARTWADTAEMLLFSIEEDGALRPSNPLAAAYTPTKIGQRPRHCDDNACQVFGCVLEDEFCANRRGRRSDPAAERLRLWIEPESED